MTMLKDEQLVEDVKKRMREAERKLGPQRDNIRRVKAFIAGDYMEYVDKIQFSTSTGQRKRVQVQINKIKPYRNAVKGWFAQNRKKPKYIARMQTFSDQQQQLQQAYSEYVCCISDFLRDNMNADNTETQQDGDLLDYGVAPVETDLMYGDGYAARNPNGEVAMESVDIDTFWWDADARQSGLLDARFMGITKKYHLEDALELFKDSEEADFDTSTTFDNLKGQYQWQGDLGSYDRIKYDWADAHEKMISVHFYQYYAIEKYWRADNPARALQNPMAQQHAMMELQLIAQDNPDDKDFDPTADILSFGPEVKQALEEAFGEYLEAEEFRRKVYYKAIVSGKTVFKHIKSPHQDGFTIKVKTGEYDQKLKIWVGMVQSMMEPQKYYNKAMTELMFVIAANSKGGVMVESDAIEDVEEFEDTYAKTDAVCVVQPGAISGNKIKPKREPFQPTGLEQIITLADNAIQDVSGIDKTFLGSSENKLETAALQRLRIRQIVTTMACYVDAVDLFQKEHARLMLDLIRIYAQNNRGALFRIIGAQQTSQFMVLSEEKIAPEYDIDMQPAPITIEERAELAEKFMAMGDKLVMAQQVNAAMGTYAMAAKYMALDHEDYQQLIGILQPQQNIDPAYVKQLEQKVQQYESQMSQMAMQETGARTAKLASEAQLNTAKQADLRAGIHQKAGQTTKLVGEAEKLAAETKILETGGKPSLAEAHA